MDKNELIWAAKRNNADEIKKLIENGADVEFTDDEGVTALIYAAQGGNVEAIKILIEKGADIEAKDKHGCTALVYAAQFNNTDAIITLIENGADIGAKDKDGRGALRYAAQFANKKAMATISRLLCVKLLILPSHIQNILVIDSAYLFVIYKSTIGQIITNHILMRYATIILDI